MGHCSLLGSYVPPFGSSLPDRKSVLEKKEEKKKRNAFHRIVLSKKTKEARTKMDAKARIIGPMDRSRVKQIWKGVHQYRQEGLALLSI
jgi:hypothetical protein